MPARVRSDHLLQPAPAIMLVCALLFFEALSGTIFSYRSVQSWIVMSVVNFAASFCLLAVFLSKASASRTLRPHWLILASFIAVRTVALVLWSWILFVHHGNGQMSPHIANLSNLLFLYCTVPMFIVLSLPSGKAYPVLHFSIDALLYAVAGFLAWLIFYKIDPYTDIGKAMASYYDFFSLFNVENVVLTIAALLRVLGSVNGKERNFYRTFFWVLLIDTITELITSFFFAEHQILVARVFNSASLWCYSLLFYYLPEASDDSDSAAGINRARAAFLDLANPMFITLVALALGIYVARNIFWAGVTALVVDFFLFGLRATLLQLRFVRAQTSLQQASDRLEELSLKDSLTGVANRRCFDRVLEREWSRAVRGKHPLSLILVDVDYFKLLNDHYGHRAGDDSLIRIARALCACLPRIGDLLARYGGEEFAVILPETDQAGAEKIAARMQSAISELEILNEPPVGRYLTISAGIASYPHAHYASYDHLVEASDQALYQAKANGRNRIEFAAASFPNSEPMPSDPPSSGMLSRGQSEK